MRIKEIEQLLKNGHELIFSDGWISEFKINGKFITYNQFIKIIKKCVLIREDKGFRCRFDPPLKRIYKWDFNQ